MKIFKYLDRIFFFSIVDEDLLGIGELIEGEKNIYDHNKSHGL